MIPVILDQRVQETKSRTTADRHIIRTTNSQCNFTEKNKKDAPDLPPPLKSVWCIEQSWILCLWGTLRYRAVTGPAVPSCFTQELWVVCFEGLISVLSFTMNNNENYQKPHSAKHCQPVLNPITDPSGYIPVACGYPGRGRFPPSFFFKWTRAV